MMKNTISLFTLMLSAGMALAEEEVPTDAASEARVKKLVEQLGDTRYPLRESAQKALLKEGERILPILEKLGPVADPEVRRRLDGIRRVLSRRELVVAWDAQTKQAPAINAPPGPFLLTGRVQIVQKSRAFDTSDLGSLVIELYVNEGGDEPVRRELWKIDGQALKKLARRE